MPHRTYAKHRRLIMYRIIPSHSIIRSNKNWRHILSPLLFWIGWLCTTTASAQSSLPLIQQSDITYLGAFALPSWNESPTYGTSSFEYGGHALTSYHDPVTGSRTLFLEGHAHNPGAIAQVEVPGSFVKSSNWSALPEARLLQRFVDVNSAPDPGSCTGNPSFIYGMLGYGGRLIVAAACSYGGTQTTSHGVRSLDLSSSGFQGYFGFTGAVAPPRALGGPMTTIPSEWQASFGGPAFTGNCCISVTGSTSAGPSLTVFDPNDVGVRNPIPGKTVLFYPLSNPVCGAEHCEAAQSPVYNLTSVYGGVAFPRGSRSVLFVTAHGTGCYWYGGWDQPSFGGCSEKDPALSDVKGPHAPPYRYQILAYDANDLLAVKTGAKQTWQPKPYAVLILDGMPNSGNDRIKGAGYDSETGRLYIAQDYGDRPRLEVYQITVSNQGAANLISTPKDLRILQ
jgi:hypothetical protein